MGECTRRLRERTRIARVRVIRSRQAAARDQKHNITMESVIVRDSGIMSGAPTFRGARVLVRTLFDYLKAGHDLESAGLPNGHSGPGFTCLARSERVLARQPLNARSAGRVLDQGLRDYRTSKPALVDQKLAVSAELIPPFNFPVGNPSPHHEARGPAGCNARCARSA
jgi:hypothetical protein